jgi:hypothetical protein
MLTLAAGNGPGNRACSNRGPTANTATAGRKQQRPQTTDPAPAGALTQQSRSFGAGPHPRGARPTSVVVWSAELAATRRPGRATSIGRSRHHRCGGATTIAWPWQGSPARSSRSGRACPSISSTGWSVWAFCRRGKTARRSHRATFEGCGSCTDSRRAGFRSMRSAPRFEAARSRSPSSTSRTGSASVASRLRPVGR